MLAIPRRIKGVSHPFVNEIYMKKEIAEKNDIKNILVIMTQKNSGSKANLSMMELLTDLKSLQANIEEKVGQFDRVDIKSAS